MSTMDRRSFLKRSSALGLTVATGCSTARRDRPAAETPVYRLIPMNVGECSVGENHLLGDPYSDETRVPFTLYAFLADGGPGRRALVDLGPAGLTCINRMFRRHHIFRNLPDGPDDIRQPHGNVFDWLKRLGLNPEDINDVIFTHLHADHHGLIDGKDGGAILQFTTARIHISKRGWQENLDKRAGGRWNSYVDYAFSDYLLSLERTDRLVVRDDGEVAPGIDVIYLGGHEVCSRAVRIRTKDGPAVVCSDEVYRYDLLQKGVLARLRVTHHELLRATEKLVALSGRGAVLLPCHEPRIWEFYQRYGDDWLRKIKPLSQQAADGFRRSPKRRVGEVPGDRRPRHPAPQPE